MDQTEQMTKDPPTKEELVIVKRSIDKEFLQSIEKVKSDPQNKLSSEQIRQFEKIKQKEYQITQAKLEIQNLFEIIDQLQSSSKSSVSGIQVEKEILSKLPKLKFFQRKELEQKEEQILKHLQAMFIYQGEIEKEKYIIKHYNLFPDVKKNILKVMREVAFLYFTRDLVSAIHGISVDKNKSDEITDVFIVVQHQHCNLQDVSQEKVAPYIDDPLYYQEQLAIMLDLTQALNLTHSLGLLFGDLSLKNLFLTQNRDMAHLGVTVQSIFARENQNSTKLPFQLFDDQECMAPQFLENKIYSRKTENYAFGICMSKFFSQLEIQTHKDLRVFNILPIQPQLNIQVLIENLTNKDPQKRPQMKYITSILQGMMGFSVPELTFDVRYFKPNQNYKTLLQNFIVKFQLDLNRKLRS